MDDILRCYEILCLKPGANENEIRQAYLDQLKIYDPDRYSSDPRLQKKVQRRLKEINIAYEYLKFHPYTPPLQGEPSYPERRVYHQEDEKVRRKEDEKVKWYLNPIVVILLLFFVLGPLGLPLLYKSPKFNKPSKIILTVIVAVYTIYLIYATIKIGLELSERMQGIQEMLNQ